MLIETCAGAVLFNPTLDQVYLIEELPAHCWLLPKGHIEAGESVVQAALREVREETGFRDLELLQPQPCGPAAYHYMRDGEKRFKTVHFFAIKANSLVNSPTPQMTAEWLGGKWCSFAEAEEMVSFANLKGVLVAALKLAHTSAQQQAGPV